MARRSVTIKFSSFVSAILVLVVCSDLSAQRRPFQLGGRRGITAGGGQGFRIGENFGMHFGGGQGATFGGPNFGMHFGNGQGAHFGGPNWGMQFGGGQGVQFGRLNNGYPANSGTGYTQSGLDPSAVYPQPRRFEGQRPGEDIPASSAPPFSLRPNAYADRNYGQATGNPTTAKNGVAKKEPLETAPEINAPDNPKKPVPDNEIEYSVLDRKRETTATTGTEVKKIPDDKNND